MFTAAQLDTAKYTVRHEQETKVPLNVGTIDIGNGQFGPYLMTPVPPYGSLSGDVTPTLGLRQSAHIAPKQYAVEYGPKGYPWTASTGESVLHLYGDGSV